MSDVWNVNWDEVNPGVDLVAAGDYTFRVVKAEAGKYDPQETHVHARISSEGPYHGQTMFVRIPNPVKAGKGVPADDPRNWVIKRVKGIMIALGEHPQPGESLIDFFNRCGAEGKQFEATVTRGSYVPKDSTEKVETADIKLQSIRPAAV